MTLLLRRLCRFFLCRWLSTRNGRHGNQRGVHWRLQTVGRFACGWRQNLPARRSRRAVIGLKHTWGPMAKASGKMRKQSFHHVGASGRVGDHFLQRATLVNASCPAGLRRTRLSALHASAQSLRVIAFRVVRHRPLEALVLDESRWSRRRRSWLWCRLGKLVRRLERVLPRCACRLIPERDGHGVPR